MTASGGQGRSWVYGLGLSKGQGRVSGFRVRVLGFRVLPHGGGSKPKLEMLHRGFVLGVLERFVGFVSGKRRGCTLPAVLVPMSSHNPCPVYCILLNGLGLRV